MCHYSFFAARSFTTVADLNRQALAWRDEVAAQGSFLAEARLDPGTRGLVGREMAESTPHFQEALNELLGGGRKLF